MSVNSQIRHALRANGRWFRHSGVMLPEDGSWGVAERVLLTNGNEAATQAKMSFPAWTDFDGGCILEQRRADCCFETAYYFLLLSEALERSDYAKRAENILQYLYERSGLFSVPGNALGLQDGVWNWSHIKWNPAVYFDDNAWCFWLAEIIGRRYPELDKRFNMRQNALIGTRSMVQAYIENFNQPAETDKKCQYWQGDLKLPHWGALATGAFAMLAPQATPEEFQKWRELTCEYYQFVKENLDKFNPSEWSYTLLGLAAAVANFGEEDFGAFADEVAMLLLRSMDPVTGALPSCHYEAPQGETLIDLIYTMNWALVGLQSYAALPGRNELVQAALDKIVALMLDIQDDSSDKAVKGCWRGMMDLTTRSWGGGDRFEGGANSIYTGWTNAPIGWSLAQTLVKRSLVVQ